MTSLKSIIFPDKNSVSWYTYDQEDEKDTVSVWMTSDGDTRVVHVNRQEFLDAVGCGVWRSDH